MPLPLAWRLLVAALLIAFCVDGEAASPTTEQVYEYRIKHPIFGDVGSYINTVRRNGLHTDVETKIQVTVTILGNVMYRQEAERHERWTDGRLAAFRGVTETNGTRVEISGHTQGNRFIITAPGGTVTAPADVYPTNPWSPRILKATTMMAPATGRLMPGRVVGVTEEDVVRRDGTPARLRRYEIETDKRQVVWFDDQGIARAFRIEESGAMIDFVLVRHTAPGAEAQAEAPPDGSTER
jgi:hypothetical protein